MAHSALTAVLFVFWDTAPKGARHPYFQSHQMDCDGSWLDQVGFAACLQAKILTSGSFILFEPFEGKDMLALIRVLQLGPCEIDTLPVNLCGEVVPRW